MKVLQICAYAARYGGNFLASLKALEAALEQQGVKTAYLFPETARDMPWCRELCSRAQVYFAGLNRFSPKVYRQIKAVMADADVIHSHFELYDCLTAMAKKKHQKLFWHLHDSFEEVIDLPHRIINKFQYGWLGKKATLISPNDHYSSMVAAWGFPGGRIIHVDNAVEFSRLHRENKEIEYDFLVFGGFYRIKGLDVLMDACRILRDKGVDFRLGVVGYPDTWRFLEDNYPELKGNIRKLEPSEDVSGFYNAAGAYICASRRECFSYAVLEALYMGKTSIVSRIPGNQWAVGYPSVTAFPTEDAVALAAAMERQLTEPCSAADRLASAEDVEKRYCARKWAQTIKEIYFGDEITAGNHGVHTDL